MTTEQHKISFQKLYSTLFDHLYRYVRTRIPHTPDAEDIVADTLVRVYERIEQYEETTGTLEQWVFGIAKHKIIDHWRSRKIVLNLDEAILMIEATERDADQKLDDRLLFEKIMDALPPDIHALFALRYIDGLTYQEIADLTKKRPESIRQFFSRAHAKLRQQFSSSL